MFIISFHSIYLTNLFVIHSPSAMLSIMFSPLLGYSTSPLYSINTVHAEGATPQFEYHIEYFPRTPKFPPQSSVEVAHAPGAIHQQSAHKYVVPSTKYSVDLVIVLFSIGNTCHRSCDLVTHHTLCCI